MAYITRLSIYENDYNKQQTIHHTNSKFKKYNSNNEKMNDLTMNDSDNNCVLITSHTLNKQISSSNSNEESYSNSNEEKEQDKNNRNPFIKPIQLNNNNEEIQFEWDISVQILKQFTKTVTDTETFWPKNNFAIDNNFWVYCVPNLNAFCVLFLQLFKYNLSLSNLILFIFLNQQWD